MESEQVKRGIYKNPDLPIIFEGIVIKGFGRGSKELGCPTANIPIEPYEEILKSIPTGVYYGVSFFTDPLSEYYNNIYKTALSIGWNPYYKNEKKTIEAHLISNFPDDFYNSSLKIIVLGYIRPEWNFTSLDGLIDAIKGDIDYTNNILDNMDILQYKDL